MKKAIYRAFLLCLGCIYSVTYAATVDTADTYSNAMHKTIKAVVVKPDSYSKQGNFPVVYLLHGYSGNYRDWITKVPAIKQYADQFNLIIVGVDGNFGSWYFDSPIDSSVRYETYVSSELVSYMDSHYKTIKDRSGRGITGLSMGGHGAFYLAFRHQDVYGVAGSMSGGVDIRPFPGNWDIAKLLGTESKHPENWEKNTVINLTNLLTPNSLALTFDCGTDDFFYKVNMALHEKLAYMNIPHDFTSRPGGHTWEYWANSVQYHLTFMSSFFNKKK